MATASNSTSNVNFAELSQRLQTDLLACDLKYCLFNAAAHSLNYDSCLKPFPPMFVADAQSNIDQLIQVLDAVPPLRMVADSAKQKELEFLQWLLTTNSEVNLTTVPRSSFDEILEKPGPYNRKHNTLPSFIFEVNRKSSSAVEQRFQWYREEYGTKFAFHGSKTSNFYSILNHGLNQHLNKVAAFGEGTYLSEEVQVSLLFSPTGMGWKSSLIGETFSCVALCEYIDHPQFAKTHVKKGGAQLPEKYILVTNNDVVLVRYLLIYSNKVRTAGVARASNNRFLNWISNNKLLAFVLFYVMILGFISMNNRNFWYHVKKYWFKK